MVLIAKCCSTFGINYIQSVCVKRLVDSPPFLGANITPK